MDGGGGRARRTRHDSDDDSGSHRRKRRRDASGAEPDLSKPVRFVSSSGSVMPSRDPWPGPVSATAEEDEAKAGTDEKVGIEIELLPTMFGKIRDGTRARREKKERERAAAASRTQASVKPAPASPGSVRSNAKVVEMMRIMMYVDGMGLGKDGQGITEPVPVTERHKHAGLGYDEESMTQSSKPPTSISTKEERPPPPRWSKKARARKPPALTRNALPATRAERALEEEAEGQPTVVQKVIDRRGRQERVLTDLSGLNDEQAQGQGHQMQADDDFPMPKLRHNVRVLVDDTEADVVRLD